MYQRCRSDQGVPLGSGIGNVEGSASQRDCSIHRENPALEREKDIAVNPASEDFRPAWGRGAAD
jgi:hypothetical protein